MDGLKKLRKFDAFTKTAEDFRIRTTGGAIVSIISLSLIVFLFVSEVIFYLATEVTNELYVDTSRGDTLRINVDVVFPHLGCAFVSLDAMDVSGTHQLDVEHNIFKKRLDEKGNPVATPSQEKTLGGAEIKGNLTDPDYCGSCYGAEEKEGQCCNNCAEVREAYRRKGWAFVNSEGIEQCVAEGLTQSMEEQKGEGCNIYGFLEVNKVAGNFHFAPGKSFQQHNMHIHDLLPLKSMNFNLTHEIRRLSFGEDVPGLVNPLDGSTQVMKKGDPVGMYQYFVKVVPTVYTYLSGETVRTNQFSVTEHFRPLEGEAMHGLPGVFVMYDISPIMVQQTEHRKSFTHFLTGVCAIVGGIFTVAGLFDSFIYHSSKNFAKKMEMGKAY